RTEPRGHRPARLARLVHQLLHGRRYAYHVRATALGASGRGDRLSQLFGRLRHACRVRAGGPAGARRPAGEGGAADPAAGVSLALLPVSRRRLHLHRLPLSPAPRRCHWAGGEPQMIAYHDREWGAPLRSDRGLFELLTLEGAQAGLSWSTVLQRRSGYR